MLKLAMLLALVCTLSQPVSTSLVRAKRGTASHRGDEALQHSLLLQHWGPPQRARSTDGTEAVSLKPEAPIGPIIAVSGKPITEARGGDFAGGIRRRAKRKVISRGGYYIVRSSSGSSPWSSTSHDSGTAYHNSRYQGYGYNTRGPIGDAGSRMHSFHSDDDDEEDEAEDRPGMKRHNRRATRKRLNRSFKREIARYALMYGAEQTAKHYAPSIGRRLKQHVIAKFVDRHRESFQNLKKRKGKNKKEKAEEEEDNIAE